MSEELVALLSGQEVGRVTRERHGRLLFTYTDEWRASPESVPLSLSMPLAAAQHGHARIDAFLWGLLPDNEVILDRWARRFHVSARNSFALISHVGEDCAGAVQFVEPERLDSLRSSDAPEIQWLRDADIAERLRALRGDPAAWRAPSDTGQFSLAGAQPKTALLYERGRWGVPSGRMPTTHILKPPSSQLDGHVENEHFCLLLARELGLPTASSEVRRFEDEVAIVVERYDRARTADLAAAAAPQQAAALTALAKLQPIVRLHQEDFCQALGVPPTAKYQAEGGPSPADTVELLRMYSSHPDEDIATFVDALAFNWLIAGTDGHAKNYSVLHGAEGRVRLAPLYDVASALPYKQLDFQKLKLAMKIGGKYRVRDIGATEWRKLARELRLPEEETLGRVQRLATRLAERSKVVRDRAVDAGLSHKIIDQLAGRLVKRAREVSLAT